MDTESLRAWLNALDSISYYDLFGKPPETPYDDLRRAFHAFAESFYPDAHRWRHPNEQAAIGRIYRRGMEAWRVLSDVGLRARYDEATLFPSGATFASPPLLQRSITHFRTRRFSPKPGHMNLPALSWRNQLT